MKIWLRAGAVLVFLACLACLVPLYGWWDEGHMLVNRAAALNLPDNMPKFLRKAESRITYLGPEPDRWKTGGVTLLNAEDPEHYLNLEMLGGMELPERRYRYYTALAAKKAKDDAAGVKPPGGEELTPEHVGTQPYAAMEVYARLTVALRDYRHLRAAHRSTRAVEQDAVLYAGWLGHYVGDGAQPLHVTVNYNGWAVENPNGYTTDKHFHSKFEGEFVQRALKKLDVSRMLTPPVRLEHPFADYARFLRESNAQVETIYRLEKAGAFEGEGTPESVEFVRGRLAAGAQMLLNLWYTAWLESANDPAHYRLPMTELSQSHPSERSATTAPQKTQP
jgi:hypothetical protein